MHDDLYNELQEMNMLDTCEQSGEELHARVHMINKSPGRNVDPPTAAAQLRLPEHLAQLDHFMVKVFVCSIWHFNMPKSLLTNLVAADVLKRCR